MRRPLLVFVGALICGVVAVAPAAGVPEQTPKRGGTVVVGVGREPPCVNPVDERCPTPLSFLAKVLEPAFALAPDFTLRPQLVTGATYTKTPPFTISFEVHPDARWSDRVPVTARDFVFTHNAIVEHLPPELQGPHRLVRSVREVGAKTVRLVLRERTADWRTLFSSVLPEHALRGQDLEEIWSDGIENPRTGAPIGNGPFLLSSWERGKQMILVRNPRYWGPHTAYLDRIVIRFCQSCPLLATPTQVLAGLRQGDVDMAVTRDASIISELRSIPGVNVRADRLDGVDFLHVRVGPGGHPALGNKRVRQALAYGIDREAIVQAIFGELDSSYRPSNSAVFFDTHRYYRPNWDSYRHRPALARRLLERAGCRRGADGIYVCNGDRLSLRLATASGVPLRERTVELIQRHLRQVGVEVQLSFASLSIVVAQLGRGGLDMADFAWFNSSGIGPGIYGCRESDNVTGYCQRLVTADLNQADRILDADQRARVLNRADRRLALDVPVIPLYQPPAIVAFRATIRNFGASSLDLVNAENWWLAE
jgi:peptide/nickel transport system substrate-binding protein